MTQGIAVHPAAAVFPMLSDDELAELAEDIKANGLLHPILLDADGVLIDGRNRLAACTLARVEPRFETFEGDPIALIVSANVSRRHLTKSQRAMALAKIEATLPTQSATRASARIIGVDAELVRRARYVLHHAPDLVAQVEAGASLNQAYQIAAERRRSEQEQEEQRQKRLDYIEQERERLLSEIERGRQQVGHPVQIPPEPELAVTFTRKPGGEINTTEPERAGLGDNLKREQALHRRWQTIKKEIDAIVAEPVIEDAWHFEGHVMAVRSWASQIVTRVYEVVEAHNRALKDDGKLKVVGR